MMIGELVGIAIACNSMGMPPPFMLTAADHPNVTLNGPQE
jgi:hypothetical protein